MKTLILGLLLIHQANAFAAFTVFRCTSATLQITKPMAYKDLIQYKNLSGNFPVESLSLQPFSYSRLTTYSFKRYYNEGDYLYNLVITPNAAEPKTGTAVLDRVNVYEGTREILQPQMNCELN